MGSVEVQSQLFFKAVSTTITAGVATATQRNMILTPEGGGGSDDLDTLNFDNDATVEAVVRIQAAPGKTIVIKDGTGNFLLIGSADVTLLPGEWVLVEEDEANSVWRNSA